ncbi:hypothetical protein [Streptococcus dentiloxodontae]
MSIRYSLWKSLIVILFGGPLGLFYSLLFIVMPFVPNSDWVGTLLASLFMGGIGIPLTLLVLHLIIGLFQRRVVFRFDEKAVTRYYGVFRNKRLVIPYDVIETIGRRDKSVSQGINEEYGSGANRIFKNTLKAAQVADGDTHLTAGSVMDTTYSYFYLVFKEGDQAVSYAKQFGYKKKGKLETIRKTRIVDFRLFLVAKFSTDEISNYMKKMRSAR